MKGRALEHLRDVLADYEREGLPGREQAEKKLGTQRTRRLLAALGSPQERLRAVHVAGSKGKGSVCAIVSSLLVASGYHRLGVFASPHVRDINERICIAREPLPECSAQRAVSEVETAIRSLDPPRPTFFEALFASALVHFRNARAHPVVIETGLGGELDATNIFNDSSLLVSVITHLGLEHVDTLGHSITEIANAKAGIMKAGTPCVVSQQSFPGAAEALQNEAYARNAIYLAANDFVDVQPTRTALFWAGNSLPESSTSASSQAASPGTPHLRTECSISMGGSLYENIELGIAGAHQCDNAAAALAAFHTMRERCGLPLCTDESVIRDGLANAHLSGRLEAQLVDGCLHVLDGAHTSSAAAALANTLRDLDRRIFLLLAMSSDKDVEGFISELRFLPLDGIVCTEVDVGGSSTRSMSAKRIAQAIRDAKLEVAVEVEHEFQDALSAAQRLAKAGGHHAMVCISGSMHAVAAFHSLIGPSGKLEVTVVRKQWE